MLLLDDFTNLVHLLLREVLRPDPRRNIHLIQNVLGNRGTDSVNRSESNGNALLVWKCDAGDTGHKKIVRMRIYPWRCL